MKPKQPRAIVDRWQTTGNKAPEYVGEWHLFVWPPKSGDTAYYVGYKTYMFRGKLRFAWLCSCAGYWYATKDNKPNGAECYHIKDLIRQIDRAAERVGRGVTA